jgi:hypothetical protein
MRVHALARDGGGGVRVELRVPAVLTGGTVATVSARAAFPEQRG